MVMPSSAPHRGAHDTRVSSHTMRVTLMRKCGQCGSAASYLHPGTYTHPWHACAACMADSSASAVEMSGAVYLSTPGNGMHMYVVTTNGTPETEHVAAVEWLTLDSDVSCLMAEAASGNARVVETHLILGETVYTFIGGQECTEVRSIVAPVSDAHR